MLSKKILPPLLLRADAHTQIGSGHMMRCLALGQAWQAYGGTATFLSFCQNDALRQRIESAGLDYLSVDRPHPDPADRQNTLRLLDDLATRTARRPWLVLDGYRFDPAYQSAIHASGFRVLVVDDTAHFPQYYADIILNQNINAERLSYGCDSATLLLLGTRYVLLRSEFLVWRDWHRDIPAVARKVLVTLGGSDPHNVTLQVIRAMQQMDVAGVEAVVVVGAHNPHYEELQTVASDLRCPMRLVRDALHMPELIAWADVAVAAGGTTCWELAFMGLPSILLVLAQNQQENVAGLVEAEAAVYAGDTDQVTAAHIAGALTGLCQDQTRRRVLSHNGRELVDGEGGVRLVSVMHGLDNRFLVENNLQVRPARLQDALSIWRLANDPVVRRSSFHPDPIPLDRHMEWFQDKIASPESRFWVVELGGTLVAQIRYDRIDSDTLEVHFAVAPALRGKGLGTKALVMTWGLTCREMGAKRVRGIVFVENTPSVRAFVKAGFPQVSKRQIRGKTCYIFERTCDGER